MFFYVALKRTSKIGDHIATINNTVAVELDWRQCGNSLALCYFAVVMELLDSL